MYGSTLFIETFIFGVNNIQVDRDKVQLWAWGFFSEKNNKCHFYACYIFVCSFGKQCPNYTQPEKLEQRQVNNDLETGNLQISVKSARRMVLS